MFTAQVEFEPCGDFTTTPEVDTTTVGEEYTDSDASTLSVDTDADLCEFVHCPGWLFWSCNGVIIG